MIHHPCFSCVELLLQCISYVVSHRNGVVPHGNDTNATNWPCFRPAEGFMHFVLGNNVISLVGRYGIIVAILLSQANVLHTGAMRYYSVANAVLQCDHITGSESDLVLLVNCM